MLEQLFEDTDFVRSRASAEHRTYDDPSTFFGSREFHRMNGLLRGALKDPDVSPYSLGFDFVQSFAFKNHSVGLLVLRCEDLSPADKVSRKWHVPLMIIPGPRDPPSMAKYMELVAEDFRKAAPSPVGDGRGFLIEPAVGPAIRHFPVLASLFADTPARTKVGNFMASAAAYLACNYCWFSGCRINSVKHTTLFLGYNAPQVMTKGIMKGRAVQIGVNDEDRFVSHEWHQHRAAYVEESIVDGRHDEELAGMMGCKGACVLHKALPYLDYNNFFLLPIAHAMLFGMVKDAMNLFLGKGNSAPDKKRTKKPNVRGPQLGDWGTEKGDWDDADDLQGLELFRITNEAKRVMAARAKELNLTSDFGRSYWDVVQHSGSYLMENWWRWVEVFSVYILRPYYKSGVVTDVLPPLAAKAWGHLRKAVVYALRPTLDYSNGPGSKMVGGVVMGPAHSFRSENIAAARAEMLEYAKIMETVSVLSPLFTTHTFRSCPTCAPGPLLVSPQVLPF